MAAYRKIGIRAFIAPLVGDLPTEQAYPACPGESRHYQPQRTEVILAWMEEAIQRFHKPQEGISILVGPTGLQLASDELYRGLIALSDKYGLARHTHCLETAAQKELSWQKSGCSAVAKLDQLGFLNAQTTLAHSIHLSEEDMAIVKERGATLVHNALSNLRLGSGIAPVIKYRDLGISVAIGCDGAASNDSQDMLEAIKIGTILHNITDPDYRKWITPAEALRFASHGGSRGLGYHDKTGTIADGFEADVGLYQLQNLSLLPKTDPLGMIVLGRPVNVVSHLWVAGRLVIAQHQPQTIDPQQLLTVVSSQSAYDFESAPKPTAVRDLCEPSYRRYKGLPP